MPLHQLPLRPQTNRPEIETLERRSLHSAVSFLTGVPTPITGNADVVHSVTDDLNGDGITDLVTVSSTGTANVYLGTATATFRLTQSLFTGGTFVALADFNGDGVLDLATPLGVRAGNGSGLFGTTSVGFTLPANTVNFLAGDFTGDGNSDLVAETLVNGSVNNTLGVSLLVSNGNGTFAAPINTTVGTAPGIGANFANFVSGDFSNDKKLDLLTPFGVMLGNGVGGFSAPIALPLATSPSTPFLTTGDFNGDGTLDVAVVPASSSNAPNAGLIELLTGKGDGSFTDAGPVTLGTGTVSALAAADLNGDRRDDLIAGFVRTSGSPSIAVLPGAAAGTLGTPTFFAVNGPPIQLTTGDANADGRQDLIAINAAPGGDPLAVTPVAVSAEVLINTTPFPVTPVVTLRSSTNPTVVGVAVALTTTVAAPSGTTTLPTGTVTFFDGTTSLGNATLQKKSGSTATATLTTSTLPAGNRLITAVYSGDDGFLSVTSNVVKETVLITADKTPLISASIDAVTLPSPFIVGDKGTANLTLGNYGGAAANGSVTVNLFASADGVIDASAVPITSSGLKNLAIHNASGGSRKSTGTFTMPSLPAGSYFILAQVVPVSGFTADQISQTPAVSPTTFQAAGNAFGTVGKHKNLKFTVTNSSGGQATLAISGPGVGTVTQTSAGQTDVAVSGTLVSSTLTITTRGSGFTFNNITVSGPLGTFNAKSAGLAGALTLGGGVRTFSLGSAAPVTAGGPAPSVALAANGRTGTLSFGRVTGAVLISQEPFSTLSAGSWTGGTIVAPSISTLKVKGDISASILLHSGGKVGSATVGSISAGNWAIPGGIGTFRVNGNLTTADIFAGADAGPDNNLGTADDIYAAAVISSILIGGSDTTGLIAAGAAPAAGSTIFGPLQLLPKGVIRSITAKGAVSADSRFLAFSLPRTASIAGAKVDTATDARFHL